MFTKRNSPGIFPGLLVFLGVFLRKFAKKYQNVTVREQQFASEYVTHILCIFNTNFFNTDFFNFGLARVGVYFVSNIPSKISEEMLSQNDNYQP